ncbi:MAG: hypothetical protein GX610_07255 [Rhodococcus sp.]|nr:hypothetical protein [Rhodococcus sp. (in: high G+C Gram-positive bacteria)]
MNDQWPPSGQQPPHQQQPYPQQPYGQYSFPPEDEGQRPMPQDVGTAAQLWWVVAALGLLQFFVSIPAIWGERDTFIDQLMNDPSIAELEGDFTRETAETVLMASFGVAAVLALIVTGVFVLFVHFMRKGKNWARFVLTFLGIILVFSTLPVLFGFGAGEGAAAVLLGGVQILQAVIIVGAIVLMHRRESSNYFLKVPPPAE